MTVPVARHPNIEPGLSDETNIALTLFNNILETANTRVELEHSWEEIKQDIIVQEHWDQGKDTPGINHSFLFPTIWFFFSCP
jgi:hypothetical protein